MTSPLEGKKVGRGRRGRGFLSICAYGLVDPGKSCGSGHSPTFGGLPNFLKRRGNVSKHVNALHVYLSFIQPGCFMMFICTAF